MREKTIYRKYFLDNYVFSKRIQFTYSLIEKHCQVLDKKPYTGLMDIT